MNNRLENMKQELDQAISPAAFFTEEDKRAVRRMIRDGSSTKRKRSTVFPVLMSFATAAVFFLLIGGFLGDKLDLTGKESNTTDTKGAVETPVTVMYTFDPKTLREGAQMGGLSVKSFSPSARYFPETPFQAVFTGTITLKGRFHIEDDDLRFYPDKDSAAENLPVTVGPQRLPTISISNYMDNKDEIVQLLKISAGTDVPGTATFSLYQVDFRPTGEQIDHADLSAINGTKLSIVPSGNTGVLDEVPLTFEIIPEKLVPVYEEFYQTGNDQVLEGLQAEDIYRMFWQAYEFNHTVTMYELLETGTEVRLYQDFIDKDLEREAKSLQGQFEKIKANHEDLSMQITGDSATVSTPGAEDIVLKKNKSGIWKIEYFFRKN